jgi:chromosome partitioning protein
MLKFKGSADLRRVVVLNPKGGSGKTTLAFNLAGYLASTGRKVALVDMDRQGSSTRWLQNRDASHPGIHGISLASSDEGAARDRCVVIPDDIEVAVIDAPAGLTGTQLIDYTCGAHAILLPVLPSDLDIHAAARLVSELLLVAQVSRRNGRLAVVANRVNERTVGYQQLMSFLDRLSISVVGTLRDTQNYVWAASNGLSIHEMARHRVSRDLEQWKSVTQWLENCMAKPLTPRDLLRPAEEEEHESRGGLRAAMLFPAAAAVALLAASLFWVMSPEEAVVATPPEPLVASEPPQSEPPQPAPEEPADDVAPEETVLADASDELRQKWQLSGIARVGGSSVMIVSDREGKSIRRIGAKDSLDGWTVKDTGEDYAVFSQDGEEVRLVLNDATVSRN